MTGPLAGIRVVELGQVIAGPFCGQLLGDLGAEVIKVEPPGKGDVLRQWGHADVSGDSLWWSVAARNKRSVTIDLRTAEGQQLVRDLVAHSDIVVENFRPGTLEGWGLGWEQLSALRPELIMVRISGFGQTGPYARRAGYASIGEAMGGLRALTGYPDLPPIRVGISIGDSLTGMFGALGALAALEARRRTGRGQVVDASIFESVLAVTESLVVEWCSHGTVRERTGPTLPGIAPSNVYPTSDGELLIAANQDSVFRRLADVMGMSELAEDPRFVDHRARGRHMHEIDMIVAGWTQRFRSVELLEKLHASGVPAGLVYEPRDMLDDPHFQARGSLQTVRGLPARRADHAGRHAAAERHPGHHPLGRSRTRGRHRRRPHRAAGPLRAGRGEAPRQRRGGTGGDDMSGAGGTAATATDSQLAEQQVFRDVIGRFASGVTIITTTVEGSPFGTTASAVSSLSMEPPMVLVCLNKTSDTQAAILKAGSFCVNILAEGQQDLAYQFARKGDKFADTSYAEGINGIPVLGGTLAHLECRVAETVTGGTHTVFLAHVAVAAGHERAPLTYFRGRFGRLESVREEEAYQAVRNWVLTRRVPLDRPLHPAALAESLELDPGHAAYALVRLAGEQVVTRTADGHYVPTPLTVALADELFGARCVIELGVADTCVGHIPEPDLAVAGRIRPAAGRDRGPGEAEPRRVPGRQPQLPPALRRARRQPAAARHLRRARHLHAVAPDARRAGLAHPVRRHLSRRSHRGLPRRRRHARPAADL